MTKLYELGPKTNNLLYGLLDLEHNFFYQVHFKKFAIEHLFKLIDGHRPVAVVSLHSCTNWYRTLIDNTNCNHWGLDTFCSKLRSNSLIFNSVFLIEHHTNIDNNLQLLIDNLNFVLETLFYKLPTKSKSVDYHFPENLSMLFADDPWVKQSIEIEIHHSEIVKNQHNSNIENFFSLTKDFNINQTNYQNELTQQINQYCWEFNPYFFMYDQNYV